MIVTIEYDLLSNSKPINNGTYIVWLKDGVSMAAYWYIDDFYTTNCLYTQRIQNIMFWAHMPTYEELDKAIVVLNEPDDAFRIYKGE